MAFLKRPAPFVLLSTAHGSLIVNRNDYRMVDAQRGYGVGFQLMQTSCFDPEEVHIVLRLLHKRKQHFGAGVVAADCGANIGVHTVEWAKCMHDWGHVHAFEAQEKIFYALAGNVILNNCLNVSARHCAVGERAGVLNIPEPNYLLPSSFGSLELQARAQHEFIGQTIDYSRTREVPMVSIDALALDRLDLLKVDVEGMEEAVLLGAEHSLRRLQPVVLFEHIKSDQARLCAYLGDLGYRCWPLGINVLAIHHRDPCAQDVLEQAPGQWVLR